MSERPAIRLSVRCDNGHDMVLRTNKATGGQFLGCTRWPDCTQTKLIPEYLKMVRSGAAQLPGMEDL